MEGLMGTIQWNVGEEIHLDRITNAEKIRKALDPNADL